MEANPVHHRQGRGRIINYRMYDKIRLWADGWDVRRLPEPVRNTMPCIVDKNTGEITYGRGYLDNLQIVPRINGLSIEGSWAKFLNGDNCRSLSFDDTEAAIEILSDSMGADVSTARLVGLEIGDTLQVERPVSEFLAVLDDKPYMNRHKIGDGTLYYNNSDKTRPFELKFYDKAAEMAAKGFDVPAEYKGQNLLRYEIAIRRGLSSRTGWRGATAATLTNPKFYRRCIEIWQNEYFKIKKIAMDTSGKLEGIATVGEAYDYVLSEMMRTAERTAIDTALSNLERVGFFRDRGRKNKARLLQKLDALMQRSNECVKSTLVEEMDEKIKSAGKI